MIIEHHLILFPSLQEVNIAKLLELDLGSYV